MFNDLSKYRKYGLKDDTIDFIVLALILHHDDNYLDEPPKGFVKTLSTNIKNIP